MSETARARRTPGAKVFGGDGWNKRMRAAREQAGLSVEDVAKALGVSPSAVRNWEGAHKFPSRENLLEFAEATNVDMVWLVTSFSADELKLAEKLVGQARAVPFFQPNRLTEPKSWDDAPTVIASFPCSDAAFATEVFDHRNSPDYEPGDIVIIDPVVAPLHDDWVLATVGPAHSLIFARYVLPGLNLDVERRVEGMLAQIKETIANSVANLVEAESSEKAQQFLEKLADDIIKRRIDGPDGPLSAWLVPSRGEPFPFRDSEDRLLGVMVEHRHPRRTVSTAHAIESQKRA